MDEVDVFYTPSFDLRKTGKAKLVLRVYDVIVKAYPKGHSPDTVEKDDLRLKCVLNEADKIIASSINTRNDVLRFYSVPEDKIRVIYPAPSDELYPVEEKQPLRDKLKAGYGISEDFLLFVGTIEPRKNVDGLIKAYHILKSRYKSIPLLVIAGMKGWMYESVFELIKKLDLDSNIIFTGYVPSNDLNTFYNRAKVFVYPWLYEGVGLPILEAFKTGVPIITSNTSSCQEVADEAAFLINPESSEELAEALFKVLNDEVLRNELSEKGLNRARMFSWEDAAKQMLEVFRKV